MYEDNYIIEATKDDLLLVEEFRKTGRLHQKFLPIVTYDLIQSGYPLPTHGEMIARPYGGTDENNNLLSGEGMWVKTSDYLDLLNKYNELLSQHSIKNLNKDV